MAFSHDGAVMAEANYLGFVTLRDARSGDLLRRFLAQTALVETIRFEERSGLLLLVGAGFEGGRDGGVVKIVDPRTGRRVAELRGHSDDATDVCGLPGSRRRIVSVGLDRRVMVHDVDDPARTWAWSDYEDYLNTCAPRPHHPGQLAVAGDSPYSYVLDADSRKVLARLDTPGDSNGLLWSEDGRFVLVADDFGRLLYFDGAAGWKLAGEARVGGAAKRMVVDPARPARSLVACYDGRVWSVSRTPGGGEPCVELERRRGMWGINVAATATRLAVPSFFDRAYLIERDGRGGAGADVGPQPNPTYGCNWVAVHPSGEEIAVTHDDGRIRIREAAGGRLLRTMGPDSDSLTMGAAFHPTLPLLATIDFYGELLLFDHEAGRVVWRKDMRFGPGITVDFSPCGRWLAAATTGRGGSCRSTRMAGPPPCRSSKPPTAASSRASPSPGRSGCLRRRGTARSSCTTSRATASARPGSSAARLRWSCATASQRRPTAGWPTSSRATSRCGRSTTATGLAHVRGVKCVHVSECGRYVATGSYDRTVMLWNADDLTVRLPPARLANSGVSGVRCRGGRVYTCSFDGVVSALEIATGRLVWYRTAADVADGH